MAELHDNIIALKPDRPLLGRYLELYVGQAHRNGRQLALLLIQIQRGQEMNALLDYGAISHLLESAAARLSSACRREDRIIRIDDYMFAIILPEVLNDGHAMLAANKMVGVLAQPYELDGETFTAEARIGIAIFPEHAAKPDTLVQYAESALTEAKLKGLPYNIYTALGMEKIEDARDIVSEIDRALQAGEFEVYYQPKINLHNRMLCGAEALVRWRHPKRGMVPPGEFIPAATDSGQLKPLTWAVVNMALGHLASWPTHLGQLTVAINISPTLLDENLVGRVADAIGIWGTKPDTLILELTESGIMSQPEVSFETIRHFRQRNVAISIDDFGTGYSSLANFRNIEATELKIDQSFVTNMLANQSDLRIVRSIIALSKSFELEVAAEGAENLSTLGKLATMGCDYAQGYCISPALPADAFVGFIDEYSPMVY